MLNMCSHSVLLLVKIDVLHKKIVLVITPSNLKCSQTSPPLAMLLECEALLKMCSTRKFLKIFDYFLFLDLLANIDVFCRKTSEIFYPFLIFMLPGACSSFMCSAKLISSLSKFKLPGRCS